MTDERRDATRRLAGQIAAHLRHLREFRGIAYVSAAPSPRRRAVTGPEGQVTAERPPGEGSPAARSPVADAAPVTWPSEQVRDAAAAQAAGSAAQPRAAAVARVGEPTWSEGQAESAPGSSRPRSRLPIAEPTALPRVADPAAESRTRPAGPGDTALRSQAQAWTAAEKLAYLRSKNIGQCTRCKLAKSRRNIVFGVGDPDARLMFVGEAPGADEDRLGEPFVGAAGRRLTLWLERLGMTREQVYIANVLKCRPPGNRDPEAEEIEKCSPFLRAQIRAIRPAVIVALGRYAGMLLLGTQEELTLGRMRSRSWTYEDASAALRIPLYVTYHPSYVIRRDAEVGPGQRNHADDTVMSDLQQALRVVQGRR